MLNRNESTTSQATNAAITAIAVASKTPFMTAFKVTMGIAAAQLLSMAIFFGGGALVLFLGYLALR